jgi:AcrR family transcriptional regulator
MCISGVVKERVLSPAACGRAAEERLMDSSIPERKGQRTRRQLLDAARVVFSRDGYLNAEISAIARAAGKSTGAFYLYFENKPALLDALIDEFSQNATDIAINRPPDFYEKLDFHGLRTTLEDVWNMSKEHSATLYALAQAAMVDPYFETRYRAIRKPASIDIRNMIDARQAGGHCKGVDAEATVVFLEALLTHGMNEIHSGGRQKFPSKASENRALTSFIEIFARVLSLDRPARPRTTQRRLRRQERDPDAPSP